MDQIPPKRLGKAADMLAYPLVKIINLWENPSVFPKKSKIAKPKPLFKKTHISLLHVVIKIIEKLTNQLEDYLKQDGLLYKYHSGFRENISTESYLVQLTDFLLSDMDKGMYTGMILIDLQKAFNTLNHKILLKKMTYLGFKTLVIKCFESHLSSRKFFVSADNIFLEAAILSSGVLQGSILGSLLFLIYINDLPQSLSESGSYLYADDTRIFFQYKDIHKIEDVLTKVFSIFCQRFVANKLLIHSGEDNNKCILVSKTKSLSTLKPTYGNHKIG